MRDFVFLALLEGNARRGTWDVRLASSYLALTARVGLFSLRAWGARRLWFTPTSGACRLATGCASGSLRVTASGGALMARDRMEPLQGATGR